MMPCPEMQYPRATENSGRPALIIGSDLLHPFYDGQGFFDMLVGLDLIPF